MKARIIGFALFVFTVGAVTLYPMQRSDGASGAGTDPSPFAPPGARPRVEVVFVLDTTGSMSGLIQAAKEKIWSIATTLAQAQPAPEIRMGLVAYRDRGDDYVTRVVDLSADLDTVYATLMDFQAAGGGDGPESVNQALHEAVHAIGWSTGPHTYRTIFLVGDAPAHMDYQDEVEYPQTLALAAARGIVVNAIQAGHNGDTAGQWQDIARRGQGHYAQVGHGGDAVAIATPYDARLAELSARLDGTRLYYGSTAERHERQARVAAAEKLHAGASLASRARRATFNASGSGAANFLGEGELVDDVASGRVTLEALPREVLPDALQAMSPAAQTEAIETAARQRSELDREIRTLAEERARFLEQAVAASGAAEASLDHEIYDAVRSQAAARGLRYEADGPAY